MMNTVQFLEALDALVAEKHLLKHPFYVLWSEGKLTREHLREYAISYYPHVAAFPRYVSGVHSGCEDAALRQELLENLIEEERGEENHPALWRRFAAALGAGGETLAPEARTPEVAALIERFLETTGKGSVAEGLAALYAYESQIPEISKTKREGLAAFYGITDPEAVRFFSVHETADVWHRQVEREALGRILETASPEDESDREKALAAAAGCLDALNAALDGVMRENRLAAYSTLVIRAVLFDAGATLVHPSPPVEEVYARELAADGARFTLEDLDAALTRTWEEVHAAEAADRYGGVRGEARVLAGLSESRPRPDRRGAVSSDALPVWRRTSVTPSSWAVYPDVEETLAALERRAGSRSRSSRTGTRTCRGSSTRSVSRAGSARSRSPRSKRRASRTPRSFTGSARGSAFLRPSASTSATRAARTTTARGRPRACALLLDREGRHADLAGNRPNRAR